MGKRNDEAVVLSRIITEDGYVQVYLNNKPVELYVLMQKTANVGTPINGYTELEDKIIASSDMICKYVKDFFSGNSYLYSSISEDQVGNILVNNCSSAPSTDEVVAVSAQEYYMKMVCPQAKDEELKKFKEEYNNWMFQEIKSIISGEKQRKRA